MHTYLQIKLKSPIFKSGIIITYLTYPHRGHVLATSIDTCPGRPAERRRGPCPGVGHFNKLKNVCLIRKFIISDKGGI